MNVIIGDNRVSCFWEITQNKTDRNVANFSALFATFLNSNRVRCLFSASDPKAQVHYCCPSVRPSLTFHISNFSKPLNGIKETWQEARFQLPLPSLCFRAVRKNKMADPASDWLRHFRLLLWNRWTEFNETWQEARSRRPLPSLCFSGRSDKQDGHPSHWLAETFSISPLKTAEPNSTKLDRKQALNLTSSTVFFFRDDRTNKMAALVYDWLRHIRLLLWNRWTEFNETWQKARSQCPLI